MNTIIIRGMELPGCVRAVTVPVPEDDFLVLVNTCKCQEVRAEALRHELNHIRMNHFQSEDPVIINEMEAG